MQRAPARERIKSAGKTMEAQISEKNEEKNRHMKKKHSSSVDPTLDYSHRKKNYARQWRRSKKSRLKPHKRAFHTGGCSLYWHQRTNSNSNRQHKPLGKRDAPHRGERPAGQGQRLEHLRPLDAVQGSVELPAESDESKGPRPRHASQVLVETATEPELPEAAGPAGQRHRLVEALPEGELGWHSERRRRGSVSEE